MLNIAKLLPKTKEAKLGIEVCNKIYEAELTYILEVEAIQLHF